MTESAEGREDPWLQPLRTRGLDTDAADLIRDHILDGTLSSGTHLVETDLAAALNVSRGTVRAALRQLRHEGLVVHRRHHGVFVRGFGADDAWEVFTLRNTLEAMAAALAARRIDDKGRQELTQMLQRMRASGAVNSRMGIDLDQEFHRLVVRLAKHSRLEQNYRLIDVQNQLFMRLTLGFHPDFSEVAAMHIPLATAIMQGREQEAFDLAVDHNTRDGEALVAALAVGEGFSDRPSNRNRGGSQ